MIYGIAASDDVTPIPSDINYTTSAVNFDGSTWLRRSTGLTGFGTPTKFTWSIWTKLSAASDGIFSDTNEFTQGATGSGGLDYFNMNVAFGDYFDSLDNAAITSAGWIGVTCSVDLSTQTARLYRGDTSVINDANTNFGGGSSINAGSDFYFGQDGFGVKITGDVADFRLWVGQYVDISQLANRRLFIRANGKPCDPSLANGSLGTPIISFIGNSSAFATNGGSGGSFTTTGTLTNASSSPTD